MQTLNVRSQNFAKHIALGITMHSILNKLKEKELGKQKINICIGLLLRENLTPIDEKRAWKTFVSGPFFKKVVVSNSINLFPDLTEVG